MQARMVHLLVPASEDALPLTDFANLLSNFLELAQQRVSLGNRRPF